MWADMEVWAGVSMHVLLWNCDNIVKHALVLMCLCECASGVYFVIIGNIVILYKNIIGFFFTELYFICKTFVFFHISYAIMLLPLKN